jgi:phosphoribosylamine---glycine ligase
MKKLPQNCRILVIGNGGREHAIIKTLRKSAFCGEIFCSTGNGGIAQDAICVSFANTSEMIAFCSNIDLVIIGPEQPLVDGVSDVLRQAGILVFAPSQSASQLESSKAFTKSICDKAGIPTAAYQHFDNAHSAIAYVQKHSLPIVVKADGLAAGKGVIITETLEQAETAINEIFAGKFGSAGSSVVIEEFLQGEELSFFAICNGENAVAFGSAQDHKCAYDGDKGPNTGGMGTYSPAPIMNEELEQKIMTQIINPAVAAMSERGTPYYGILFAGLMIDKDEPKLIEFNTRLGDPETQVILTRLQDDFLEICFNAAQGILPTSLNFSKDAAVCVVMATKGYPNSYENGSVITNLSEAGALTNISIFHASTKIEGDNIIANGGRVLGVTATGANVTEAAQNAYHAVTKIDWDQGFYRSDIGWRAIKREKQ